MRRAKDRNALRALALPPDACHNYRVPRKLAPTKLLAIARSTDPLRKAAACLGASDKSVKRVRQVMRAAGLDHTAPLERVAAAVYKPLQAVEPLHPLPHYQSVVEHRAVGLSVTHCWQIYRKEHPDGYNYSRFAALVAKHAIVPVGYRWDLRQGDGPSTSSEQASPWTPGLASGRPEGTYSTLTKKVFHVMFDTGGNRQSALSHNTSLAVISIPCVSSTLIPLSCAPDSIVQFMIVKAICPV